MSSNGQKPGGLRVGFSFLSHNLGEKPRFSCLILVKICKGFGHLGNDVLQKTLPLKEAKKNDLV